MYSEPITIGILNHNNDVFEKYISKSLSRLRGNYDLIIEQNKRPAHAYNEIIKQSNNKYIILLHADVSFSYNFLYCINRSINKYPKFGALGILGIKKSFLKKPEYMKANNNTMYKVSTLEPSCIVINKQHRLQFDNNNFDEYHLYVEDYCTQVRKFIKQKIYTMLIDAYIPLSSGFNEKHLVGDYFVHYNNTFSIEGERWGNWLKYKKILDKKWNKKVLTT